MKRSFRIHILFFALLFVTIVKAQQNIVVDFSNITKAKVNKGFGAANLCWLTDSDKYSYSKGRTMEAALKELGCKTLRFPYGHLADNYLWHTPPYDDTKNGLRPKVASMFQAPAKWNWAVNAKDGSFINAMDFDEYMQLCEKLEIQPLVVVNIFSFKYKNGPTFDELLTNAVEWVKYAKTKNFKVAYWQLGNEVDHHQKILKKEAYVALYKKFAKAMKAVDPTIKVGPGILQNQAYFKAIVNEAPELIDFTSCHQYMWKYIKTCQDYNAWKNNTEAYVPNVFKMQKAVQNSPKPNLEILITETGVSPTGKGMGDINNTYKALWFFEVLMNEQRFKNVAYSYFWGTHSPWDGKNDNDKNDLSVLYRMDDNASKPIAEIIQFANEHVLDKLVESTKIAGYIRTYTSMSEDDKSVSILLVNRNNRKEEVVLDLKNLPENIKKVTSTVIRGENFDDRKLILENGTKIKVVAGKVAITLAPLSITALKN